MDKPSHSNVGQDMEGRVHSQTGSAERIVPGKRKATVGGARRHDPAKAVNSRAKQGRTATSIRTIALTPLHRFS